MSHVELKTFASWASYPLLDIYPCVLFPHQLTFYRLLRLVNSVSFFQSCLFCLSFVFLLCVNCTTQFKCFCILNCICLLGYCISLPASPNVKKLSAVFTHKHFVSHSRKQKSPKHNQPKIRTQVVYPLSHLFPSERLEIKSYSAEKVKFPFLRHRFLL